MHVVRNGVQLVRCMALGVLALVSVGALGLHIQVIVYFLDNVLRCLWRDVLGLDGADETAIPAASDAVFFMGLCQVGAVVGMHFPAPLLFLCITQIAKFFFNALQRRHTQRFSGVELPGADVGGGDFLMPFADALRLFADDFVDHRNPLRHHKVEVVLQLRQRFGLSLAAG